MQEMRVEAVTDKIPAVTAFIDEQLESVGCAMKAQMQIDIAIDELFGNIANYAYGSETGEATVRFGFEESTRLATIEFADSGVPFDPLAKEDPDVSLSAEERKIGGLGIFLVKKTMDNVAYRYENGMNILTIQKRI